MPSAKRTATVAVVSERRLLADALRLGLDAQRGLRAVGIATEPLGAEALLRQHEPDVMLVDTEMVGVDGAELIRSLHESAPETAFLILIDRQSELALAAAVEAGAVGYVSIMRTTEEVAETVRKAAADERLIGPEEARRLLGVLRHRRIQRATARERVDRLTKREVEVMGYMARGLPAAEIAQAMGLSRYTVRTHIQNILTKLGARSKAEAVAFAMQHPRTRPLERR